MRSPKIVLCLLSILGVGVLTRRSPAQEPVPNNRIVIAASRVLDGKGGVLRNTRIVVEGSKIIAVDPLRDIRAVRRVVFVMKGGIVYKNVARTAIPAFAGVQP